MVDQSHITENPSAKDACEHESVFREDPDI